MIRWTVVAWAALTACTDTEESPLPVAGASDDTDLADPRDTDSIVVPLFVVSMFPEPGAIDIEPEEPIVVEFSRDLTSLDEVDIALDFGNVPVELDVQLDGDLLTITPMPRWPLLATLEGGLESDGELVQAVSFKVRRARSTPSETNLIQGVLPGTQPVANARGDILFPVLVSVDAESTAFTLLTYEATSQGFLEPLEVETSKQPYVIPPLAATYREAEALPLHRLWWTSPQGTSVKTGRFDHTNLETKSWTLKASQGATFLVQGADRGAVLWTRDGEIQGASLDPLVDKEPAIGGVMEKTTAHGLVAAGDDIFALTSLGEGENLYAVPLNEQGELGAAKLLARSVVPEHVVATSGPKGEISVTYLHDDTHRLLLRDPGSEDWSSEDLAPGVGVAGSCSNPSGARMFAGQNDTERFAAIAGPGEDFPPPKRLGEADDSGVAVAQCFLDDFGNGFAVWHTTAAVGTVAMSRLEDGELLPAETLDLRNDLLRGVFMDAFGTLQFLMVDRGGKATAVTYD